MRKRLIGDEVRVTISASEMEAMGKRRSSVVFRFSACGDLVDAWGSDSEWLMNRAKKFAGFET